MGMPLRYLFKDCLNALTEGELRVEAGKLTHCLTTDEIKEL